jgi:hypothetical protein
MKLINSLSGGKTSSYMAVHYPADYNIFSLVRIEAEYCKPKDESIIKYVSDKIGMDFIATAESDKTLYVVRDLEQIIGKEIIWVTGETFESIISKKKILPNMIWRFCTTELKMKPIFEWWHKNINEVIKMQIGFRYDEKERANYHNTKFKTIIGKHDSGKNKWDEIYWRELSYPMIDRMITYFDIYKWSNEINLEFPLDSNCVGCFWKPVMQLRKNWDNEPNKMKWFSDMEEKMKSKFKKEMTYQKIKKIGLQQDFKFGTGAGCQAGYCTD